MALTVKICGLTTFEQAVGAAGLGADALGFVRDPKSPRFCSDISFITKVRTEIMVETVGVYSEFIHEEENALYSSIQCLDFEIDPGLEHVPVIRIGPGMTMESLLISAKGFPRILLDSYHPRLGGGTGETVDWGQAAEIVASFEGNVILAGGLSEDNVAEAIRLVRPAGVDASTRLEISPGVKDMAKVEAFIRAAKDA